MTTAGLYSRLRSPRLFRNMFPSEPEIVGVKLGLSLGVIEGTSHGTWLGASLLDCSSRVEEGDSSHTIGMSDGMSLGTEDGMSLGIELG